MTRQDSEILAEAHVDWFLMTIRPLLITQFMHGYKHGQQHASIPMKSNNIYNQKKIKSIAKLKTKTGKYTVDIIKMVINKEKSTDELAEILNIKKMSVLKYRMLWQKKYPEFVKNKNRVQPKLRVQPNRPRNYGVRVKVQKNATEDVKVQSADEVHPEDM